MFASQFLQSWISIGWALFVEVIETVLYTNP